MANYILSEVDQSKTKTKKTPATHKIMALRKLVQRSLNTPSQVSGPFVRTLTHYPVDDTVSGLNDDQR